MTTSINDWQTIRGLLWDDDEHILIAKDLRTTGPIRQAIEFSEQPNQPYCCANSFKQKTSRKKANVQCWHTWVIEFDEITVEKQRELWEESGLPHTLRVFSGNKSVHTFIRAEKAVSPTEWKKIADALKAIFPKADKKVLTDAARLCRTPNGTRENGEHQTVEFIGQRVPLEDLRQWIEDKHVTESTETTETTEAISIVSDVSVTLMTTGDVIKKTLPTKPGERNARILDLARGLRFNACLADRPFPELRPFVEEWHRRSVEVIGTKEFDETWADFIHAWPRALIPLGDVIHAVWKSVTKEPLPVESQSYDSKAVRLLVALCKTLGSLSGNGNFFLSTHVAGKLLKIAPMQVLRKLRMIEVDGLIQTIKKGNARLATRYTWKGAEVQCGA